MEGLGKVGWGGPGGDDLQDSIVLQPGPHHGLEGGAGSGCQAPGFVEAGLSGAGGCRL